MRDELALAAGYVTAGLGPITAVSVMSPLRNQPLSTSVVLLVLIAIIAAAAALGGPRAGTAATLTAALSFDFLLIAPYHELKIGPIDELWPVFLLFAYGAAIVVIARRRWQHIGGNTRPSAGPRPNSSHRVQRVALLIEQGADVRDLVAAVQVELTGLLLARSCRFDAGDDASTRPRIERDGTVSRGDADADFPQTELEIPVRRGRHRLGCFVVEPTPGAVVPLDHRIVAVILTDHLAAVLASKPTAPPRI